MYLDSLYAELELDFQPADRAAFAEEIAYVANSLGTELASSSNKKVIHHLNDVAKEMGNETVALPHRLVVIPLNPQLFTRRKIEIPPNIRFLFNTHDFYLVEFPITLIPRTGWEFDWLECRVAFNPGATPEQQPIIYHVFPQEEWQEIIHAWQSLEVGLDECLDFKLEPERVLPLIEKLDLPVQAAVKTRLAGKAGLLVGPFDYSLYRAKVRSQGSGNMKAIWRLEGGKKVKIERPRLGVVLQVPKGVEEVDAYGVLAARRTFPLLAAEWEEMKRFFSKPTRSFLELGAPATDKKPWVGIIPIQ